jgi:hypothetical protein
MGRQQPKPIKISLVPIVGALQKLDKKGSSIQRAAIRRDKTRGAKVGPSNVMM